MMPQRYMQLRAPVPSNDLISVKGMYNSEGGFLATGVVDELDLEDWDSWMRWDVGTTAFLAAGEDPKQNPASSLCSPNTCPSDLGSVERDTSPSVSAGNDMFLEDAPFDLDEVNDNLLFSPTDSMRGLAQLEARLSPRSNGMFPDAENGRTRAIQRQESVSTKIKMIPNTNTTRSKPARPLQVEIPPRGNRKRKAGDEADPGAGCQSRKRGHNAIEKRYRTNLNEKINCLRDAISTLWKSSSDGKSGDDDSEAEDTDSKSGQQKIGKAAVLTKALEYIKHLERNTQKLGKEVDTLKAVVGVFERLATGGTAAVDEREILKLSTATKWTTLESIQDEFKQVNNTKPRSRSMSTPEPGTPYKRPRRQGKAH